MTQQQQHPSNRLHRHSRTAILWLMFFAICSVNLLDIANASSVATVNLSTKTETIALSSASPEESGFRLKFLQKSPTSSEAEQQNTDNNGAVTHKRGELYLRHRDNEEDNNDSNVSSKSNDEREGFRYRREDAKIPSSPPAGGSKVITTNWGTYEEQAPVVIESASRTIDPDAMATGDDEPVFSDEVQSREGTDEYGSPAGVGSISYEEYEDGRFEGRQFYPSRGGGYGSAEEQEQPDGYYRQKYYATTPRTESQEKDQLQGEESEEGVGNRPRYPNRGRPQGGKYRTPPQREEEEEEEAPGIMSFVQKAKTFYDVFRAMNSAWKTIEDRYRKNGQGIFMGDPQPLLNQTTEAPTEKPVTEEKTTRSPRPKAKKRKTTTTTTKAPTTTGESEDENEDNEEQQAKDEYRARRSSLNEAVNGQDTATTNPSETESSSDAELESESDLESSESDSSSSSSSSTAVAEGRYIKGDPLKGYYDFVITEGSYKFWATFQVGTALLIIYSTFAAIYYSKVNPLVSDYDYIDYLGGGRSLSDDSDFVDTDAPAPATTDDAATNSDGSKTTTLGKGPKPEGTPRNQRLQKQSSAGWFDWLPHAGHTLRFILEAIDKEYDQE